MSKPPAFMLYAADFYMDTASWTVEQVGIYTRLLFYQWVNGSIPNDLEKIARIAGCMQDRKWRANLAGNWRELCHKFATLPDGNLANVRLEETRQKQQSYIENQRVKGKIRAQAMWQNHIAVAKGSAKERLQPKDSSSSSISFSNKETTLVPSGTTACPHLKIIEEYNRILGAYLPQVKPHLWKGKRASWLASRWKERESRQNIEWWSGLFERVKATPFMLGKNDREWKADLEWIVKDSNFVKILEGKYEKKTGRNVVPGNGSGQLRVLDGMPSGTGEGKESGVGPAEAHRGQGMEKVALPLANDGRGRHGEVEEGT